MHHIQLAETEPVETLLFPGTAETQSDPTDLFPERLRKALINTIVRKRWSGLVVQLRLMVYGALREDLRPDLLDAARELVTNSIDHGLYQRSFGRISVTLRGNMASVLLEVVDNGWGVAPSPTCGAGSSLLRSLGAFSLTNISEEGRTTGAAARLLISNGSRRWRP